MTPTVLRLAVSGLMLSLSLGLFVVLIWQDGSSRRVRIFGWFLLSVILWNVGDVLYAIVRVTDASELFQRIAYMVFELGFASASILLLSLVAGEAGYAGRSYSAVILLVAVLIIFSHGLRIAIGSETTIDRDINASALLKSIIAMGMSLTLGFLWYFRRKLSDRFFVAGVICFALSEGIVLSRASASLIVFSVPFSVGGLLLIGYSIFRRQILMPLVGSKAQIEALQRVGVAISRHLSIDTVLNEITVQATNWVKGDGAAIYLVSGDLVSNLRPQLKLVTVYNLPEVYLGYEPPIGQGIVSDVVVSRQSIRLGDYGREWLGGEDFPLARETIGGVIGVPLIHGGEAIGVLVVVSGRKGRLFSSDDAFLLELLGAQAAVAIAHSQLFDEVASARNQLEAVLTSTENPVIAIDRQSHLIFANPAARHLFSIGQNDSSLENMSEFDVFPKDLRQVLRDVRTTGSHIYEFAFDNRMFLCHLTPLGDKQIIGWVTIMNDITQLKELDRLKSEMVRMASHDLKNPLMGAMAYLDLLADDVADTDNPELAESVSMISRQLDRMERIIRGVLDLERMDSVIDRTEMVDPISIIEASMAEMQSFAHDNQVELRTNVVSGTGQFRGNSEQFKRALSNLIENAIKFTIGGGVVLVSLRAHEGDNSLLFSVRDEGIGIPEALQSRIFDRFYRGQQVGVEHVTGSGLGLSLVKSIVEQHNGKIWLESTENRGTTFFVSVPRYE